MIKLTTFGAHETDHQNQFVQFEIYWQRFMYCLIRHQQQDSD